jgi:4,5-dihydroxyphthalate decarboxylase
MTAHLHFTTVTRTQGNNTDVKNGTVRPQTFAFDFVEVPVLVDAFRRMVRGLEFDICEMALTTYICARSFGKRFTAIPVFLVRGFHHGAILFNAGYGIKTPQQLEGKKVGVNRGYTVTTGVWARGILQNEGVDLNRVTWVCSGDEHVEEFVPPRNVEKAAAGSKLPEMLATGELAAVIGIDSDTPGLEPLFQSPLETGLRSMRETGIYPINHVIVVKDEILERHPDVAPDLFDAFARSKKNYVERLRAGRIEKPTAIDEMHRRVLAIAADPLPYGIEPNRRTLEALIDHAVAQHILQQRIRVDELFAHNTRGLVA